MDSEVTSLDIFTRFRLKGFQLSIDDFGTGLSSYSYLRNLPVDYLKIDGHFVKSMLHDPIDRAMVESIHHIGHVMGLKTIAEFVEDLDMVAPLRSIGVDYVQGYALGKPEPFIVWPFVKPLYVDWAKLLLNKHET